MAMMEIQTNLPATIVRDLKDGEVLCPKCEGRGFRITDNHLRFCGWCYDGILRPCQYCGTPSHYTSDHCCDAEKEAMVKKGWEEWQNSKNTLYLPDLPVDTVVFDDFRDKFFFDLAELAEAIKDDDKPWRLWACTPKEFTLEADRIIDDACYGLHEEAREQIGQGGVDELQTLLNEWVNTYKPSTTYKPNYDTRVVLRKEAEDGPAGN